MKIDDPSMTQISLSNNDDYMIKSGVASTFQNSSLKSIVVEQEKKVRNLTQRLRSLED